MLPRHISTLPVLSLYLCLFPHKIHTGSNSIFTFLPSAVAAVAGAQASANLYSLIETCKANNIEPYTYLVALFRQLPLAKTVEDLEAFKIHWIF